MLEIRINNEPLDLQPGTQLELEQENPFLQFGDEIKGDFSLPFSVSTTERNLRLLGYAGLLQTRVTNAGIPAVVYDSGRQHSVGKIRIEKPQLDLNNVTSGSISCYYLSGVASFYEEAKKVKLRTANYGGERSFPWAGFNRNAGFWGHIHAVIDAAPGSYDYAFYPCINKDWSWDKGSTEVVNFMFFEAGQPHFNLRTTDEHETNVIVPYPYLHYVLKKALEQIGWTAQGDVLNDAAFKKITMLNFKSIYWVRPALVRRIILADGYGFAPEAVVFNLAEHVPDITLTEFIIALKNRFGWQLDFDSRSKTIKVRKVATLVQDPVIKDFSAYVKSTVPKTVLPEKRVYKLTQSAGDYQGEQSFTGITKLGTVLKKSDLPAPALSYFAKAYLVTAENNWYTCRENEDLELWYWDIFIPNIYDKVPAGATEEISTSAATVGSEFYSDFLELLPRKDQNGMWQARNEEDVQWGIELLFYHGLQANTRGETYPFASHHIYAPTGVQVAAWSLAFEGLRRDGVDVGLYAQNWKLFLEAISSGEEFEPELYLPLFEFLALKFFDVIHIAGVRMYAKKLKPVLPYNGSVTLECVRI